MSYPSSHKLRERTYQLQRADLSRRIEMALRRWPISFTGMRIADVGCGQGHWLEYFRNWGIAETSIFGVDRDPSRIGRATLRSAGANLCISDARMLPFRASVFDAVSQFTLFSSLRKSSDRRLAACEMLRVLKPGGFVLWHDFFVPNPLNRSTRRVSAREIRALFPGCEIRMEKVTLLAPLARLLFRVFGWLAGELDRIPVLRTHYLALIRKPMGQGLG